MAEEISRGENATSDAVEDPLVRVCHVCGNSVPAAESRCTNCWARQVDQELVTESTAERERKQGKRSRRRRRLLKWSALALIPIGLASWFAGQYFAVPTRLADPPASTISAVPIGDDWPMFHRDPTHRAVVVDADHVPEGKLKWKLETDWHLYSSPAVVDGVLYLTTGDARVLALEAETGEVIWERELTGAVFSSPAVAGDLLFFGLRDRRVLALDRHTGEQRWAYATGGGIVSSPAVKDGVLYITSGDGKLYALDASTGSKRWIYSTGRWSKASPAVFEDVVVTASYDTMLHVVDIETGKRRLDFFIGASPQGSPAFGEQYVFFSGLSGDIKAIDWTKRIYPFEKAIMRFRLQLYIWGMLGEAPPLKGFVWNLRGDDRFYSTPVVASGRVYAATVVGTVVAADEVTGERLWEWTNEAEFRASPSIVNGTLFIGDTDGRLHALDAITGEHLWQFQTGHRITATPVVSNGLLYLASWDGTLYAIE